jgi:hypothetical protein
MKHRRLTHLCVIASVAVATIAPLQAQETPVTTGFVEDQQGADVIGAFVDSLKLLMLEHGIRIAFQEETRAGLEGPFWLDYKRSVHIPRQWEDTDMWAVNYIGHPIHGAAAGYIWLDHDRNAPLEFSRSRRYWVTRGQAAAWAAAYSLQFEYGPLSEASIGNVGLNPATNGWVDHVVTPIGAFGLIVAEDAVDKYFVKWAESRTTNPLYRFAFRIVFNPARTLSNTASGRWPWHRDGRPLRWRPDEN